MKHYFSYFEDDSGVALITGLVILVLLTAIGTYAIHMTEIEEMLSANLKASKQAFYIADAGVEWGKQQIGASLALPPVPATTTQALSPGTYTVTFPNFFPQVPAMEYTLTARVVGNVGNASKTLQAVITKIYDLSDAAIAVRGNEADTSFTGNAFLVDGRDYNHLDGTLTSLPSQLGISVPSTPLELLVEADLVSKQDRVQGVGGTSTVASVGVSSSHSSSYISTLADALCDTLPPSSPNRMQTPNNGDLTLNGTNTFGTRTLPQVYCVDGVGTPGNMSVDIYGNFSGAGVLVVRNSDLVARGNFQFEGLIIVTGNKVGFGMIGGGTQDVYGSVMINETNWDPVTWNELVLGGNASVKRSQSALAMARQLVPAATLASVIPGLPSSTQRISWVEVNN